MEIKISKEPNTTSDVLVLGLYSDKQEEYKEINPYLNKEIEEAIKKEVFNLKPGSILNTRISNSLYKKTLVVCLGKSTDKNMENIRRAIGEAAKIVDKEKNSSITTNIAEIARSVDAKTVGIAISEGAILSTYKFIKYKTNNSKVNDLKLSVTYTKDSNKLKQGLEIGRKIANATILARDLVNEPSNVATPSAIEAVAKALTNNKLKVRVVGKKEIEKKKMGGLLAVSSAGGDPPRILVMDYKGGGKGKTALVGKGITFDTGGINLKPESGLPDMKSDMGGAAAVIGAMKAISSLGLKKDVVGVVPLCENAIGSKAYKPSDIIKMYNGKTVEILNTDAEGRLILADAMSYAEKDLKADTIIDIATLTGATMIAVGQESSTLITEDEKILAELLSASEKSRDRTWPLPFFEEYQEKMDGDISDLKNISGLGSSGRYGGAITAGVFLSKFKGKAKWAHIDLGGYALIPQEYYYNLKGATGAGVRLLTYYFMEP